ncbi:hypothetical protein LCGC14_1533480 [marine sediment metagenome]|uniref:Uncharacterized protein n=1 Tax=marine sediment metagenome TaxID=412755 RepID=A0A0F9LB60_9ZZZZ
MILSSECGSTIKKKEKKVFKQMEPVLKQIIEDQD